MALSLDSLQQSLQYEFSDPGLLELALTHRSAARNNNERLEFLGDALLDFIVGEILYECYADASEGELSRLRSRMVNKSALAGIGRDLDLGQYLRLGTGEVKSGGKQRDSILADSVEALIAAVYLDGGLSPCSELVSRLTADLSKRFRPSGESKDFKTRLQEWLQARGLELPQYLVVDTAGEAHARTFYVECLVPLL